MSHATQPKPIDIEQVFAVEHLPSGHKIKNLLDQVARHKERPVAERQLTPYYWDAAHYGLENVRAYQRLNDVQRAGVLRVLSSFYMTESYFVERMGFTLNSRMMMEAPTIEEKSLYAMFAADEANHLISIQNHLERAPTDEYRRNPFLQLLGDMVGNGSSSSIVFIIQVFMEGYGLVHYRRLADSCLDPSLKAALMTIVHDEAAHHGSGVVLHRERPLDAASTEFVFQFVRKVFAAIKHWPQATLFALSMVRGPLSAEEQRELFADLDYEGGTAKRLYGLRALLEAHLPQDLVSRLDEDDTMRCLSMEQLIRV